MSSLNYVTSGLVPIRNNRERAFYILHGCAYKLIHKLVNRTCKTSLMKSAIMRRNVGEIKTSFYNYILPCSRGVGGGEGGRGKAILLTRLALKVSKSPS